MYSAVGNTMSVFSLCQQGYKSLTSGALNKAASGYLPERGKPMSIELQKPYELIELEYEGDFATITMNNPKRRNALSVKHMLELTDAFRKVGESRARGVFLAANGPVFSAGHDFADAVGQDLVAMRKMLKVCTTLMDTIQEIPQPVLARVHG